jgi:hypothetical protein
MSDQRRQPQQERLEPKGSGPWPIIVVGAVALLIFGGAFYVIKHKSGAHDAFAKCLAEKRVSMYGLYWCEHCAEQKTMFGSSFKHIPYVECGIKGSRSEQPECIQAGIKNFPTWKFADGSLAEGTRPLEFLSQKSGCSLQ